MQILKRYEQRGVIEIVPWNSLVVEGDAPWSDPNKEVAWRNQETAMNECLFKYKVSHRNP
ncbi:unnamed protein product [Anisakis simplex]|uniref:Glycosyltransferase family 92 protein n=1 Tax=Anisakis simplex TaxID=6269 RepID=A0A0M3JM19_ANISI|nr:unnamed protein product [Anisakis simplex]